MRHLGWLFAGAVACLAVQVATSTKGEKPSEEPLDRMEIAIRNNHNNGDVFADRF